MQEERTTCVDCAGTIPAEALLCRYCGAVQPDSGLPVGGPLARDWVVAALILIIVAITSLVLIDLQLGSGLVYSGSDACEEGVSCEEP